MSGPSKSCRAATAALAFLLVAGSAALASARAPAGRRVSAAKAIPHAPLAVGSVLMKSWTGEGAPLRDQLAWTEARESRDDDNTDFDRERAVLRACQHERYAASRDGLLDGAPRILRDC